MKTIQKDKVQEIIDTAKNTTTINTNDINEVVRLQDLFNVNIEQAIEIMQQLDQEGKRRLLWIITTVSGYDTFEFWLTNGMLKPWGVKRLEEMESQVMENVQSEFDAINKKERELIDRERELDQREAELKHREAIAELEAEKKAGKKVREQRELIKWMQAEMDKERVLNRKAKRIAYLMDKI